MTGSLQYNNHLSHLARPGVSLTHLNPERLHSSGTSLVDSEAVGEVDNLVLRAVDHQDWGRYSGNFVDTETFQLLISSEHAAQERLT